MKLLKTTFIRWCLCLGAVLGFSLVTHAQTCGISFSPNPGTGVVDITSYWIINGYSSPLNPALFMDTVVTGNVTVPPGVYNGWCIDVTDSIDDGPETYNVLMFSSCDPNLDSELANLGYTYSFTYPSTDTNGAAREGFRGEHLDGIQPMPNLHYCVSDKLPADVRRHRNDRLLVRCQRPERDQFLHWQFLFDGPPQLPGHEPSVPVRSLGNEQPGRKVERLHCGVV